MELVDPVNEGKRGKYSASLFFKSGWRWKDSFCMAQLVSLISFHTTRGSSHKVRRQTCRAESC